MKSKKLVKEKRLTNPNKVNQYTEPDPRQALFLAGYMDPNSPTFSNAYQSAVAAKYSEEYAKVITAQLPDWLSESLRKNAFKETSEKHMLEVLSLPNIMQAMGAFGPIFRKEETFVNKKFKNGKTKQVKIVNKIPVMVPNTNVIKQKNAVAFFALEAHDKATYGKAAAKPGSISYNFTQINGDKEKFK